MDRSTNNWELFLRKFYLTFTVDKVFITIYPWLTASMAPMVMFEFPFQFNFYIGVLSSIKISQGSERSQDRQSHRIYQFYEQAKALNMPVFWVRLTYQGDTMTLEELVGEGIYPLLMETAVYECVQSDSESFANAIIQIIVNYIMLNK